MMNWISRVLVTTGVMTFVVGGAPVSAQQSPSPAVDKNAVVLIPGVLTRPVRMASAVDRAGGAADRNSTSSLERSAIGVKQGDRDDGDGVQGGNAHDDESRIGDDGQPA